MASTAHKGESVPIASTCSICREEFCSKSKLFKHLEEDHGVVDTTRKKMVRVAMCVGWISDEVTDVEDMKDSTARYEEESEAGTTLRRVESTLFSTIHSEFGSLTLSCDSNVEGGIIIPKSCARASQDRPTAPNAMERTAHGLSDMFVIALDHHPGPEETFVKKLNAALPDWLSVFSCKVLPGNGNFQAHRACTQRRYEYMLPLDGFLPKTEEEYALVPFHLIESKVYNDNPQWKKQSKHTHQLNDFETTSDDGDYRIRFFRVLKVIMKRFGGRFLLCHNFLSGGACPDDPSAYRIIDRFYHKDTVKCTKDNKDQHWIIFSISGDAFIRGQVRRMVAFAVAMARGWLPLRYFDYALYKAAYTKPVVEEDPKKVPELKQRKKMKIEKVPKDAHPDLTGPKEIERGFESIVDLPNVPGTGLYLAETKYAMFESKHTGMFLDPRRVPVEDRKTADVLGFSLMKSWKDKIQSHIMECAPSKYLLSGEWAQICKRNCDIMVSKADRATALRLRQEEELSESLKVRAGFPHSLNSAKILAYEKVLGLLREADNSGKWPSTSVSRRQVMSEEGLIENGGRGGTFTVGQFPKNLPQPKGNELFPELAEACFDLEKLILPERTPSTTIAINRHAQFKFHRDSGAGAGQTRSAIVALGDFAGGELQCEFDVEDIRYAPYEFDGWSQRHSTLPFVGERYSLVWFTPLGIE